MSGEYFAIEIISVRFMDINVDKNFLNGVNFVKIGHSSQNGQNWVSLEAKMTSYIKILESGQKNFLQKFLKLFQSGLWT